ncbi:MAG: hypothetical protein EP330_12650 [Deltaproteobacteria bacterium]|nr:MAG: hypothetical protein EP330_12650 [Deltaproteobacteria bacterium]
MDRAFVGKLRHSTSLQDYLREGGVLRDGELSDAGYLLFGEEPQDEYPGAGLVLQLDRERHLLTGPIAGFSMRLRQTLGSGYCVSDVDQALNVAFAARDWSDAEPVHAQIWSDRLEIEFESGSSALNERLEAAMKRFGWRLWQDNRHVIAHRRAGGAVVMEVAPRLEGRVATKARPTTARAKPNRAARLAHDPTRKSMSTRATTSNPPAPNQVSRTGGTSPSPRRPPPAPGADGSWQLRLPRRERRRMVLDLMHDGEERSRAELQQSLSWSRGTLRDVLRDLVDAQELRTVVAELRDPTQRYAITSAGEQALSDDA